nr:TraU family protein [Pseudomonas sp. 25 R 14]
MLSPHCLAYQIVGICFWRLCTPFGCTVKTSTKVRHFISELVASSYATAGSNPWAEMAPPLKPSCRRGRWRQPDHTEPAPRQPAPFQERRCHQPSRRLGCNTTGFAIRLRVRQSHDSAYALLPEHPEHPEHPGLTGLAPWPTGKSLP